MKILRPDKYMGQIFDSEKWKPPRIVEECFYERQMQMNTKLEWNSCRSISKAKNQLKENVKNPEGIFEHNLVMLSSRQLTIQLLEILRPSIENNLTVYLTYAPYGYEEGLSFQEDSSLKTQMLYPPKCDSMIMCYLTNSQKEQFMQTFGKPNETQEIDAKFSELLNLLIITEKPEAVYYSYIRYQILIALRERVYKFQNRNFYVVYVLKQELAEKIPLLKDVDEQYKKIHKLIEELDCVVKEDVYDYWMNTYPTCAGRILQEHSKTAYMALYLPLTQEQAQSLITYDELLQANKIDRVSHIFGAKRKLSDETDYEIEGEKEEGAV